MSGGGVGVTTLIKDTSNTYTYTGSAISTFNISLTTNGTNRLALLYIYCPGTTVSSISGGGTWTKRLSSTGYELWTCPLATVQTATTVTVTLGTTISTISAILSTYYGSGGGILPVWSTGNTSTPGTSGNSISGSLTTIAGSTDVGAFYYASGNPGNTTTAGTGFNLISSSDAG